MKQAIELIRVSTKAQADEDRAGIPAQHAANLRTAARYDLQIVRTIEIVDVSGAAILFAPEMQELLQLIAEPQIHGVVTYAFSRLMRPENYADFGILQSFVETNTLLYFPEGPIDFASKHGRIVGTVQAAYAGLQRLEFLEASWNAKEEKRKTGGFAQSRVCLPYGVGYDDQGWHYTSKAERVKEAFRLLLAGYSYTQLAVLLGVTIPGLRAILQNPIYTGWRVIDKRRDPSPAARRTKAMGRQGDRPKIHRLPEDVIRVKVIAEPLISEAEFTRAQAIIAANRERNARTRSQGTRRYTYNGFLICAACGQLVYTHFRRAEYYVCKGRKLLRSCQTSYMRRDILDPQLDRLFTERLTDRSFLAALTNELWRRTEQADEPGERLEAELFRVEARRARTLDAFIDGAISGAERDQRLAKLDAEIGQLRTLCARARPGETFNLDALLKAFEPFGEFEFLGRADRRRILAAVVPQIKVAEYNVAGVSVLLPRGDELNRTGTDSSPPRA